MKNAPGEGSPGRAKEVTSGFVVAHVQLPGAAAEGAGDEHVVLRVVGEVEDRHVRHVDRRGGDQTLNPVAS